MMNERLFNRGMTIHRPCTDSAAAGLTYTNKIADVPLGVAAHLTSNQVNGVPLPLPHAKTGVVLSSNSNSVVVLYFAGDTTDDYKLLLLSIN